MTKTKQQREIAEIQKAAQASRDEIIPAPDKATGVDTRGINDTRGANDPVLGHFVEVVEGEHKGRYGTFWNLDDNGVDAVVRTRDSFTDLLPVPISALRPAQAGRR